MPLKSWRFLDNCQAKVVVAHRDRLGFIFRKWPSHPFVLLTLAIATDGKGLFFVDKQVQTFRMCYCDLLCTFKPQTIASEGRGVIFENVLIPPLRIRYLQEMLTLL